MKKKSILLLALLVTIYSLTGAGFNGKYCNKSNREEINGKGQCGALQTTVPENDMGFELSPLNFFLFIF